MWVTSDGGKRLSPLSSEKPVPQGVENSGKVVVAYVQNDEFTNTENDAQFVTPPAETKFLAKLTCRG